MITNKLLNIKINTNVSLTKPLQYYRVKEIYNTINTKQPGNWHDKTVKDNYDIIIRERKIKKIRNVILTDNLPLTLQNLWDPKLAYLYFNMNFKIYHGVYYGGIAWNKSGQSGCQTRWRHSNTTSKRGDTLECITQIWSNLSSS